MPGHWTTPKYFASSMVVLTRVFDKDTNFGCGVHHWAA
jgi:hypothetical protein